MRSVSRLSVSQCRTIESYVATARPDNLKFNQSFGSRYSAVSAATAGRFSKNQRMWPNGSLPLNDGTPPVSWIHLRSLRGSNPSTLTGPRTLRCTAPAPRESIQITASCNGSPAASTGIVPDH